MFSVFKNKNKNELFFRLPTGPQHWLPFFSKQIVGWVPPSSTGCNLRAPQNRFSIFPKQTNSGFPLFTTGCNLRAPHYRLFKIFPINTNSGFTLFTTTTVQPTGCSNTPAFFCFLATQKPVGFPFLPLHGCNLQAPKYGFTLFRETKKTGSTSQKQTHPVRK